MAYTNYTPRTENITGASLTGSDGTANRTYTMSYSNPLAAGVDIIINGVTLHQGAGKDYTVSSSVITFLNIVDNTDVITIHYFTTTTGTTSTTLKYATTLQLAAVLGIKSDIPSWDVGNSPSNEEVGTGDNSTTVFYLDHRNILSDSYTLYYGATAATTTTLTETTHYTLDKATGKITLTGAGVTLLDTNKIYAEYSYLNLDITDAYLIDVLQRCEAEVDNAVNTTFTDGTADNPSYPTATDVQPSKGRYDRTYFTRKRPLIDVTSKLASDITDSDLTLDVTTGEGVNFPSAGTIVIGSEIITYTGVSTDTLTGLTRGVDDSTAAAHSEEDEIHTTVLEVSGTDEGTTPSWTTMQWKSDFYAEENGKIYISDNIILNQVYVNNVLLATSGVSNRTRIRYLYGWSSIPKDITRLTLLFAKRALRNDTIGASLVKGRNEFNPETLAVDDREIQSIIDAYIEFPMGNT